jgi:uncharacterized membrane-anchored protein
MLLLEGCISNFMCARYYFLYVEFSDQSLPGQTIADILSTSRYVLTWLLQLLW